MTNLRRPLAHLTALVVTVLGLLALTVPAASACTYDGGGDGGGVSLGGVCPPQSGSPGGQTPGGGYVPQVPPPPVYEDYWTPACATNGPPDSSGNTDDVMCMGAATGCDYRGQPNAILMRHYRKEVGAPGAQWELVGTECRGPSDPTQSQPQVSQTMVLDQAYAAAPHPTAHVQPGDRSFVNLPNNYWAQADPITKTVDVLGHAIPVQFTIDSVTWSFGDGATASGTGVDNAAVGAPGAVEHAYEQQGTYSITVNTRVGAHFTLPGGQTVDLPSAFSFDSQPVVLPIGEIQTRVDLSN